MNRPDIRTLREDMLKAKQKNHIPDFVFLAMLADFIIDIARDHEYNPDDILNLVKELNKPLFTLHDTVLKKYLRSLHEHT